MIYPPDSPDRSRASANCAGSYLHSTWWSQQAYAATFAQYGQLSNALGGSLAQPYGSPFQSASSRWWQGLFGTRNIP